MPANTPPPRAPTRQQRLVHDIGNSLSAARLRLDLALNDPQCSEATREHLRGLVSALDTARGLADQLEASLWGDPAPDEPSR